MRLMSARIGFVIVATGLPPLGACGQKQVSAVGSTSSPTTPALQIHAPFQEAPSQLTAAELDRARQGLAECWYVNPGARSHPVVEIKVELLPDGTVTSAEVVDAERMQTDSDFREEAQAGLRAVRKCSPLKLPPDKYLLWKSTIFRFDASGVFG
jgi:hypothetical protein